MWRNRCFLCALCSLTTEDQVLLKNVQELRLLPLLQRTAEHQGTTSDTEQHASSTHMQAVLIFHEGTCTSTRNNCLRGRKVRSLLAIMLDLSHTPENEYRTYEVESSTMASSQYIYPVSEHCVHILYIPDISSVFLLLQRRWSDGAFVETQSSHNGLCMYTYKASDGVQLNNTAWFCCGLLTDDVEDLPNIFLKWYKRHIM